MARSAIQVEGVDKVRRALRKIEDGAKDLKEAHREGAEIVADESKRIVPVRSGALRDTIRAAGQVGGGVVRAGFARIPYAGVIHFGWAGHNIEPQPYLYDAADNRTSEVLDAYDKQLANLIQENGLNQ